MLNGLLIVSCSLRSCVGGWPSWTTSKEQVEVLRSHVSVFCKPEAARCGVPPCPLKCPWSSNGDQSVVVVVCACTCSSSLVFTLACVVWQGNVAASRVFYAVYHYSVWWRPSSSAMSNHGTSDQLLIPDFEEQNLTIVTFLRLNGVGGD